MSKIKIRLLLSESFVPFLLLILALFFVLWRIDSVIENREHVLVIDLNDTQHMQADETETITQQILLSGLSVDQQDRIKAVNNAVDSANYGKCQLLIRNLSVSLKAFDDTVLTLAYCLYKQEKYDESLQVIERVKDKSKLRYYYNKGLIYGKNEKTYNLALKNYLEFIRQKPESYPGNMQISLIYYYQKRYSESLKYAEKALKYSGGDSRARTLLRIGKIYRAQGDYQKAQNSFEEAVNRSPALIAARVELADMYFESNPGRALNELEQILAWQPNNELAYKRIATYYFDNENTPKAVRVLQNGLSQIPNSVFLRSYLGHIYLSDDDYSSAQRVYLRLTADYPENALYWFNLGRAYFGRNKYDLAMQSYKQALGLDKEYYEAVVNSGITSSRLGQPGEAIQYYLRAIRLNPKSSIPHYNLGILYYHDENYTKALQYFQNAIDLEKDNKKAYFYKGLIYRKIGDEDKAVDYYNRALLADPAYDLAYVNLVHIYQSRMDLVKSTEILNQAIQYTDSLLLQGRIGYNHFLKKEYEEAVSVYEEILDEEPDFEYALIGLARTYYVIGQYEKCFGLIEKFIEFYPKEPEGRYIYMLSLYMNNKPDEAKKQRRILQSLSPGFKPELDYGKDTYKEIQKL